MTPLLPKDQMKDSGIPWVGLIPKTWDTKRAKFLFSLAQRPPLPHDGIVTAFRDGQVTLRSNRRTDGFTNALKEAGYQRVQKGDLVIHAMDAFAGAIGVSDSDGKCTPVYSCCVPSVEASSEFYARCVRTMSTTGFIESLAKGIRERSTDFRWATFAEQLLPHPPKVEQDAIVAYLDRSTTRIDTLVAKKTRFIELLREKRQALITHAVTKGLDPNVPVKNSGVEWLGKVPKHWRVAQLRRITISRCDGPFGSGLKSSNYTQTGVRVIRLQNIGVGLFRTENAAYIGITYWQRALGGGHEVLPGDLLMAGLGDDNNPLGRTCVAPPEISPALVKADCYRFRLTTDVETEYFALVLSATARQECGFLANGATRDRLNLSLASSRVVPIPPLNEQKHIVAHLDRATSRIDTLIAKTERSIELLREHRTALITAAVTGKIDLRN